MIRLPTLVLTLAAIATVTVSGTASAEGDAAAGEKVFRQCKSCHAVEPDKNRVGPSLHAIFGRKAGSVSSFANYSDGLKTSGIVWDEGKLDAYLTNPKALIADSRMSFPGIAAAEDRTNVIAYLKSLGK